MRACTFGRASALVFESIISVNVHADMCAYVVNVCVHVYVRVCMCACVYVRSCVYVCVYAKCMCVRM